MNQFRILLALILPTSSIVAHATTLKFTGPAAKTLYVCDFGPVLDCWYAKGTNICLIHNFDEFEILPDKVRISGKVAARVFGLIKDCHDGGAPEFRHHYGSETGIKCRYDLSNLGIWCDLPVDSASSF